MARKQEVQHETEEPKAYGRRRGPTPTVLIAANDPPTAALTLTLNDHAIRDRGEMLSLTDMWRAGGEDASKRPVVWLKSKQATDFVAFLAETVGISHHSGTGVKNTHYGLVDTKSGGSSGGQTFAHWQIALAYAKYLSPAFHAACNVVIRERMEGRNVQTEYSGLVTNLDPSVAAQIGGIIKGVVHRQIHDLLPALVQAEIVANQYVGVRGLTAGEVLDMAGFTNRKGLRGLSGFVSGRLRRFHSEKGVASPIASLGRSTAYVFDRALSREWLDTGGRRGVEMKIEEKRGQTVMKLVQK